jgi:predicted secreted Zn-dependent protease
MNEMKTPAKKISPRFGAKHRLRIRVVCVLILGGFGYSGPAFSEVRENLRYAYYDVDARPGLRLAPQITAASPIRENGRKFHGHTKWTVRWKFQWRADRDGYCRVTYTSAVLDAVITLPKLRTASAAQSEIFDRYLAALRVHELGHYDVGTAAAQAIDGELRNLPEMRTCDALEFEGNRVARRTLDRFVEVNRQYDEDTNHGKTQGARLTQ